ncbi:MAG: hypothetical protein AAFQ53_18425, partial [Bacteroidota bacterium]
MTSWPGNPDLLVIAERGTAKVRLWNVAPEIPPSAGLPGYRPPQPIAPLLDLSGLADVPPNQNTTPIPPPWTLQFGGLTGFAFHPRFSEGRRYRYVFVRYNRNLPSQGNPSVDVVIERYAVPAGQQVAIPSTRTVIFEETFYTDSTGGHFSGGLQFDPITYFANGGTTQDDEVYHLYAPMGDMVFGGSGDCEALSAAWELGSTTVSGQSAVQSEYTGKLLRFEIGPGVLPSGASVPPVVPDVLGRGLRNAYSFSFDPGDSGGAGRGDLWLADTGTDQPGEVTRLTAMQLGVAGCTAGGICFDFGWPWVETRTLVGGAVTNTQGRCWGSPLRPLSITSPADIGEANLALDPSLGDAVIGAVVYRGAALDQTQYAGKLFYSTFVNSPTGGPLQTGSPAVIAGVPGALRDDTLNVNLSGLSLQSG